MTTPPPETTPPPSAPPRRLRKTTLGLVAALAAVTAVAIAALLTNIFQRRAEALNPFFRVVELTDTTTNPAVWGLNFPLHYDQYLSTVDQIRTRWGGSEALPQIPDELDPRDVVAQSRLEEDPRLIEFWAGYAFAHDFREERGHAFMLEDQIFTRRQLVAPQPGTCLHCHASVYVPYMQAGDGNLIRGFEILNQLPYFEAREFVEHPIACIDCHDPQTMQLRITRPGFIEGIRALRAGEGVADYDVNRDASRQEMRTYVCAQCHVEYYFRGEEKRLTYPWAKGIRVDSMMAYYDAVGHYDWIHAVSGAPVLKAQHPEFELYMQGIHARSGVTCSDCHMPYVRVGAMKISDHHVRSPLLNIDNACQTCHRWPEDELRDRVHIIQDRTHELRSMALDAVIDLAEAIAAAAAADAANPNLTEARRYHRWAQFYTDFVEAENSMGFHADQEAARILGHAIDFARKGRIVLAGGVIEDRPVPDPPPTLVSPGRPPIIDP